MACHAHIVVDVSPVQLPKLPAVEGAVRKQLQRTDAHKLVRKVTSALSLSTSWTEHAACSNAEEDAKSTIARHCRKGRPSSISVAPVSPSRDANAARSQPSREGGKGSVQAWAVD